SDALIQDLADDPADGGIVATSPWPRFDHHLDPFGKEGPDQAVHAVPRMKVRGIVECDGVNSCIGERSDVEPDETVPAEALPCQGTPAETKTAEEAKLQR